jgi:hypothetical protein
MFLGACTPAPARRLTVCSFRAAPRPGSDTWNITRAWFRCDRRGMDHSRAEQPRHHTVDSLPHVPVLTRPDSATCDRVVTSRSGVRAWHQRDKHYGSSCCWAGAPARPCIPRHRRQPAIRTTCAFHDPGLQGGAWRDPMFACRVPSCLQRIVRTQSLPLFFWRPATMVVQDKDLHSAARPRSRALWCLTC